MRNLNISLLLVITLFTLFSCKKKEAQLANGLKKVFIEGAIQGSTYHITYMSKDSANYQKEIVDVLNSFNKSLSVYDSLSIISRINRNDSTVEMDSFFKPVFIKAQEVSAKTNGAFDMTVGPLVHLWGFNNGKKITVTQAMLDSIKPVIGYQKVHLQGNKIVKDNPHVQLDANALAQGYSSDIIGKLLESKGVKNYMVEIGGEVICKGLSPRGDSWNLGINQPIDDSTGTVNEIQAVMKVNNMAVSTSGNYRKFYYHNGKKYSHEIDPHTGFPVTNNLLSVTVTAPDCITADAYATAFMVLGVVQSVHLLQTLPGIDAYFIYKDKNGKNKVLYTKGFEKYLAK